MPPPSASKRRSAAMTICRTLGSELSVVAKPLAAVNIKNIPDKAEPAIRNWIRQHAGNHEVYGSAAAATHRTGGRQPADLDIVLNNPRAAANALAGIMKRKGIRCKVVPSKSPGAFVVQIGTADALDIHPITGHSGKYDFYGRSKSPMTAKGITIQTTADQLLRKANAITAKQPNGKTGAAPHRNLKDTQDFIATAKTLLASMELKSKAQQARATKVRSAIRVWEAHLKTIKGAPVPSKRKPISKTRANKFKAKAKANPATNIDDLVFSSTAPQVTERKTKRESGMQDIARSPYAHNPYGSGGIPTLGEITGEVAGIVGKKRKK